MAWVPLGKICVLLDVMATTATLRLTLNWMSFVQEKDTSGSSLIPQHVDIDEAEEGQDGHNESPFDPPPTEPWSEMDLITQQSL